MSLKSSAKMQIEGFMKKEPGEYLQVPIWFEILITFYWCSCCFATDVQDFFQGMVYPHVYPELSSTHLMNSYAAWQYLVCTGLGAVIAFTSDILICKYYVECVTTGICFIVSLTLLTLNLCVAKEGQGSLVWWLNALVHVICYGGCPNSLSLVIDQLRHGKWSIDVEMFILSAMFGYFVSLSLLSITTHFVQTCLGLDYIFLSVFVWVVTLHGVRCAVLFAVKKHLYMKRGSINPVLEVLYITIVKIKRFRIFRRKNYVEDDPGTPEFNVGRFWSLTFIGVFYIFWGFGYLQIRTNNIKHGAYFAKGETILQNSFAFYGYSGVFLGPLVWILLNLMKKRISPSDIKPIVIAETVLGLGLLSSAIYENIIANKIGPIPNEDTVQYRIVNGLDFDLRIISQMTNRTLLPYECATISKITAYKGGYDSKVYLRNNQSDIHERGTISGLIGKSVFYMLRNDTGFTNLGFEPLPTSKELGIADSLPLVYLLTTKKNSSITIVNISTGNQTFKSLSDSSLDYVKLPEEGIYDITGNVQGKEFFKTHRFKNDVLYQILLHDSNTGGGIEIEKLFDFRTLSLVFELPTLISYSTGRYLQAIFGIKVLCYQSPPKLRTIVTWIIYSMEGFSYIIFAFQLSENLIGGHVASNILFVFHVCCLTVFLYVTIKFKSYIYPE